MENKTKEIRIPPITKIYEDKNDNRIREYMLGIERKYGCERVVSMIYKLIGVCIGIIGLELVIILDYMISIWLKIEEGSILNIYGIIIMGIYGILMYGGLCIYMRNIKILKSMRKEHRSLTSLTMIYEIGCHLGLVVIIHYFVNLGLCIGQKYELINTSENMPSRAIGKLIYLAKDLPSIDEVYKQMASHGIDVDQLLTGNFLLKTGLLNKYIKKYGGRNKMTRISPNNPIQGHSKEFYLGMMEHMKYNYIDNHTDETAEISQSKPRNTIRWLKNQLINMILFVLKLIEKVHQNIKPTDQKEHVNQLVNEDAHRNIKHEKHEVDSANKELENNNISLNNESETDDNFDDEADGNVKKTMKNAIDVKLNFDDMMKTYNETVDTSMSKELKNLFYTMWKTKNKRYYLYIHDDAEGMTILETDNKVPIYRNKNFQLEGRLSVVRKFVIGKREVTGNIGRWIYAIYLIILFILTYKI